MSGIGTDPEETGGLERAVQEARRHIHEELAALPAWTADVVRDEMQRLERAVEARAREQVAREIERSEFQRGPITGSNHYRGGYTDGLGDAARIARNGTEEQQ